MGTTTAAQRRVRIAELEAQLRELQARLGRQRHLYLVAQGWRPTVGGWVGPDGTLAAKAAQAVAAADRVARQRSGLA